MTCTWNAETLMMYHIYYMYCILQLVSILTSIKESVHAEDTDMRWNEKKERIEYAKRNKRKMSRVSETIWEKDKETVEDVRVERVLRKCKI